MTTALTIHETLIPTPDGWRLRLERFTPRLYADRTPILCIHGHATTAWSWRGGPGGGLVGALVDAGREVWTVDLRGTATSVPPRRGAPVRIADKAALDLPAALRYVLSQGAPAGRVDVVGHSLGGVLIYLLGLSGDPLADRIRRAVTVGSPLHAPESPVPTALLGRAASLVAGRLGRLPVCGLAARWGRHAPARAFGSHFAPNAVAASAFDGFMRHGVSDIFGTELVELAAWLRHGDARVLHPALSMLAPPSPLPFPTRFIVGADDTVTSAAAVTATHGLLGGLHGDLHVLPGYRHGDILIGDRVRAEVAPLVVAWLTAARPARRRPPTLRRRELVAATTRSSLLA